MKKKPLIILLIIALTFQCTGISYALAVRAMAQSSTLERIGGKRIVIRYIREGMFRILHYCNGTESASVASVLTIAFVIDSLQQYAHEENVDDIVANLQTNLSKGAVSKLISIENTDDLIRKILSRLTEEPEEGAEAVFHRVKELWAKIQSGEFFEVEGKEGILAAHTFYARNAGKGTDLSRKELVQRYLEVVKSPVRRPLELNTVAIIPTYACGNNCRHCQVVQVPASASPRKPTEERYRAYDAAIEFAARKGIDQVVVSGGEPIGNALNDVLYILRNCGPIYGIPGIGGQIFITTNGSFAKDLDSTKAVLQEMRDAFSEGAVPGKKFGIQLSIDSFHQEVVIGKDGKLKEKISIENIANVAQCILDNFPDDIGFNIVNHYNWSSEEIWGELLTELEDRGYHFLEAADSRESKAVRILMPDGNYQDADFASYLAFAIEKDGSPIDRNGTFRMYQYLGDYINTVGWAQLLHPFEYAVVDESHMAQEMSVRKRITANIQEVGIDSNGQIYVEGGVFANLWHLGTTEEGIDVVLDMVEQDPLFLVYCQDLQQIVLWTLDALPYYASLIMSANHMRSSMYHIMRSPATRLYLTKMAMLAFYKNEFITEDEFAGLGISLHSENIKAEFLADFAEEFSAIAEIEQEIREKRVRHSEPVEADRGSENGA